MTGDSDFSAMVSAKKERSSGSTQILDRRTLGERSLAALTSGVGDASDHSR